MSSPLMEEDKYLCPTGKEKVRCVNRRNARRLECTNNDTTYDISTASFWSGKALVTAFPPRNETRSATDLFSSSPRKSLPVCVVELTSCELQFEYYHNLKRLFCCAHKVVLCATNQLGKRSGSPARSREVEGKTWPESY